MVQKNNLTLLFQKENTVGETNPFQCTKGSDETCIQMFKNVTSNTCCMSWTVETENESPSAIEQAGITQYKAYGLPTEKADSTKFICVTNPGIITYDGKYTRVKDHTTGIVYK